MQRYQDIVSALELRTRFFYCADYVNSLCVSNDFTSLAALPSDILRYVCDLLRISSRSDLISNEEVLPYQQYGLYLINLVNHFTKVVTGEEPPSLTKSSVLSFTEWCCVSKKPRSYLQPFGFVRYQKSRERKIDYVFPKYGDGPNDLIRPSRCPWDGIVSLDGTSCTCHHRPNSLEPVNVALPPLPADVTAPFISLLQSESANRVRLAADHPGLIPVDLNDTGTDEDFVASFVDKFGFRPSFVLSDIREPKLSGHKARFRQLLIMLKYDSRLLPKQCARYFLRMRGNVPVPFDYEYVSVYFHRFFPNLPFCESLHYRAYQIGALLVNDYPSVFYSKPGAGSVSGKEITLHSTE